MKIVAAVYASLTDLQGAASAQVTARVGAHTVLEHTLLRLMRVEGLDGRGLVTPPRDADAAREFVQRLGLGDAIVVAPIDDVHRPKEALLSTGRKWNRYAWRGGVVGATWFDEFAEPILAAKTLRHFECDAVLCLSGFQPALDPAIATGMIAQQRTREAEATHTFTQAPPGVAGVIVGGELVVALAQDRLPLGFMMTYRPEAARGDPINRPPCFQTPAVVAQTRARLTGDTRRSREVLEQAWGELGEDAAAEALCDWIAAHDGVWAGPLPLEVEIELTTDDPLPNTTLRPRGDRVPRRRLVDLDHLTRIGAELAQYDDRLVVLAGHGDPLLHPQFAEACRRLREAGVFGLAVVTPLVQMTDEHVNALFDLPVDLVQVRLDAHSAETYRRVHGVDAFEQACANIQRLSALRVERRQPQPLIACSLTRCGATLPELEAFHDHWIHAVGTSVIEGYNTFCGMLPPDELFPMTPPIRESCRRLSERLMLLADGTVARCAQDVTAENALGDWFEQPLCDIWNGEPLERLRAAHRGMDFSDWSGCSRCGEWFRP